MIYDTPEKVSDLYLECKTTYFSDYRLKIPGFFVFNSPYAAGRIWVGKDQPDRRNKKKKVMGEVQIGFSRRFDLTNEQAMNVMAHEIVHYLLAVQGAKDWAEHGETFLTAANQFNEKCGLNIVPIINIDAIEDPTAPPTFGELCKSLWEIVAIFGGVIRFLLTGR